MGLPMIQPLLITPSVLGFVVRRVMMVTQALRQRRLRHQFSLLISHYIGKMEHLPYDEAEPDLAL